MDFLGDSNTASALDVVFFVREIIETNPKLRESIVTRLLDTFSQIRSARVCACALWIIGEYCRLLPEVESGLRYVGFLESLCYYVNVKSLSCGPHVLTGLNTSR